MSQEKRISLAFDFITATFIGVSSGYDISDHPTLRVTTENVGLTNEVIVEAKLDAEADWTTIATLTG